MSTQPWPNNVSHSSVVCLCCVINLLCNEKKYIKIPKQNIQEKAPKAENPFPRFFLSPPKQNTKACHRDIVYHDYHIQYGGLKSCTKQQKLLFWIITSMWPRFSLCTRLLYKKQWKIESKQTIPMRSSLGQVFTLNCTLKSMHEYTIISNSFITDTFPQLGHKNRLHKIN